MKEAEVGDWVYKAQNFNIGKWDFASCDLPESFRFQKHSVKVGKIIHSACALRLQSAVFTHILLLTLTKCFE